MPSKKKASQVQHARVDALEGERVYLELMGELECAQETSRGGGSMDPRSDQPEAATEVDWPMLIAKALECHPERLYEAIASPEYLEHVAQHFIGSTIVPPRDIPRDVRTTVAELRRVRRGRPKNDDKMRAAARAWQLHEAKQIYRAYLRQYQLAKENDLTGNALELYVGGQVQLAYVDGDRRRAPVVRVSGAGLSPKDLALEATANAVGRTAEATGKFIFGSKRARPRRKVSPGF